MVPGTYKVRIDASNWTTGTKPLLGLLSSTNDFNSLENNAGTVNTLDDHDMGIDSTTFISDGIVSGPITLSPDAPSPIPLNEGDKGGTRNGVADSALLDVRSNLTVDFGFLPGYSLGNRVWRDDGFASSVGNDGIRNDSEAGIQGVSVTLLSNLNTPIVDAFGNGTITTDASGYYRFDGLVPGTYKVRIDASNWTTGTKPLLNLISSVNDFNSLENNAGSVNTLDDHDMGIDSATYVTDGIVSGPITLSPDAPSTIPLTEGDKGGTRNGVADTALLDIRSNLTVDFGFTPTYSVGNRVWRDDGGGVTAADFDNGLLDASEVGIKNVTVYLYAANSGNPTGSVLQTAVTDNNGYYRFDGLVPGTPTTPNQYVVVLDTNVANSSGLAQLAPSTPRFTDLTTDKENMVAQTLGTGTVLPNGLASPAFGFPANAVTTETDVNSASSGADGDGPNGNAYDNLTVDYGFVPTYSIGNRVWYDNNNNGKFELGEHPVPAVRVELFDSTGTTPITDNSSNPMTVLTDVNGYYRFDGLRAGSYVVKLDSANWTPGSGVLVGYASSTSNITQNGASTPDSFDNGIDDAAPATNGIKSTVIAVGVGKQPSNEDATAPGAGSIDATNGVTGDGGDLVDNLTADFGFYRLSVGDTVWNDNGGGTPANANNGKLDAGELGISGVIVQLYKGGTLVAQTTTDGSGNYVFNQQTDNAGNPTGNPLAIGTNYTIVIPKNQAVLNGFLSSTDLSTTFNPTTTGNGVNSDDNGTGTSNAFTADTMTNSFTLNVAGTPNTAGAALNSNNALTDNPTIDFGFHAVTASTFSIGNRVWLDDGVGGGAANNGILDGTEAGIDGVRVLLYNYDTTTGQPTTLVQTATTSSGGYYRFDNVANGSYIVIIDRNNSPVLNGLIVSNNTYTNYNAPGDKQNKGAQTALALGSVVPNGIPSGTITIPPSPLVTGEIDVNDAIPPASNGPNGDANDLLTVDFSFYRPPSTVYSIGNRIWLDNGTGGPLGSANNGIQDGNETEIANVKVNLYGTDGSGNPIGGILQTTQTDGSGYYRFDNVAVGQYVVVVDTAVANSPALNGLHSAVRPSPISTMIRPIKGSKRRLTVLLCCRTGSAAAQSRFLRLIRSSTNPM